MVSECRSFDTNSNAPRQANRQHEFCNAPRVGYGGCGPMVPAQTIVRKTCGPVKLFVPRRRGDLVCEDRNNSGVR